MTIDIGRLEDQLLQMSAEGAPGREFCEAISELARTGRFEQLREYSARHRVRRALDPLPAGPRGLCGRLANARAGDAAGLHPARPAAAHLSHPAAASR